jgi:hypothetical protein
MTDVAELRSTRPALSPAARALRLQRIFARLQEGASYQDIAAEEGLSRERLRQIVRASTARGTARPDHRKMQFARLEPALRLASRGVAEGDAKAIPLLIRLVDRLDRYCEPGLFVASPLLADLAPRPRRRRRRGGAPRAIDAGLDPSEAQTT